MIELPIACTLDTNDGQARAARWRCLLVDVPPIITRDDLHLDVTFPRRPAVESELRDLAAAESQCCSFVTWAVIATPTTVTLHITAPTTQPDAIEPIAALFATLV